MSSILRVSLAVNAVLIAGVTILLWRNSPASKSPVVPSVTPVLARSETPTAAVTRQVQSQSAEPRLTEAIMVQLEQAGISRNVLVSALREDFHRRWDRRLAEIEKRYAPRQVPEREYVEFARLRDAEQTRELKEALGEEGYLAWDKEQTLRLLNTAEMPMTADEAERAYRLQKDFDEKHRELQMAMEDGVADRADGATLQAQAQEALERDLEKLFGRQRLNQMRGLSDPVAAVHWRYGDLHPTPDQANAVVRIEDDSRAREAALSQRLKASPADSAAVAAELRAITQAREEELRRVFGTEAYENITRQNDPTYKTLVQYAETWDLPAHEIQPVYESLASFLDEAERTRSAAAMREAAGLPVNWREIDAAIEQVRQQTEAGLQSLIGSERLRRLKQNGLLTAR